MALPLGEKRYNQLFRRNPRLIRCAERPGTQDWYPDSEFDILTRNLLLAREVHNVLDEFLDIDTRNLLIDELITFIKPVPFIVTQTVIKYFYPKRPKGCDRYEESAFNCIVKRANELYRKTPAPGPGVVA